MAKNINTRIQLKRDTLANLNASSFNLKAGELAIAYVDVTTKDAKGNILHVPTALLKAGNIDGNASFKDLPFVSALAVDVYSWAKKEGIEVVEAEGTAGEVISNIEWKDDKLVITRTDVITPDDLNDTLAGYKTVQDAIAAVETDANVFIDTIAQDANGVVTITTKAVDFSAADDRFKKLQTAIEAVATEKNYFIEKIAQDAQGVITISTKAVDFSDYRTAADQDIIDATFKTKQTAVNKTGSTTQTITAVTQNENGEIDVTYSDIAFPAQTDYTVTCEDEDVAATDGVPAFKRHVLKQLDGTVCTIDVPKDMVIADGRVEGDKLILVLNTGKEIEIEVADLIEYVTGGTATDGVITVTVDPETHVVTAKINDGTITSAKFADDVDDYVDGRIEAIAKLKQTAYSAEGDVKKTVTKVEQDENGEITVTYGDIDFAHDHDASYKALQTAIEAVETEANEFVDTVAQDEQGVVTITTKKVDFTPANQYADGAIKTAIEALDVEDTEVEHEVVVAVSETDGKIAVSRKQLTTDDIDGGSEVWCFDCGTASENID